MEDSGDVFVLFHNDKSPYLFQWMQLMYNNQVDDARSSTRLLNGTLYQNL
jgi:hypothetical protein